MAAAHALAHNDRMNAAAALSTPSCLLPAAGYQRERWRNGQGWTREVLRLPVSAEPWALRLSIAEIESDAAFSSFPGVERELVLLQGNGVRLKFADGGTVPVLPPHGRVRFAGEAVVHGELVDGLTHDFNLMWRRDLLDAQLQQHCLDGVMQVVSEADVGWAVHVLAGDVACTGAGPRGQLHAGDSAWFAAGDGAAWTLQGSAQLLLIRVAVSR